MYGDPEAAFTSAEGLDALAGELDGAATAAPAAGLEDLAIRHLRCPPPWRIERVASDRFLVHAVGPKPQPPGVLRLVSGSEPSFAEHLAEAITAACAGVADPHVLIIGTGEAGHAAALVAARLHDDLFTVDQLITAAAPSAHVPRIPRHTRMLSMENRDDPVALLGSLVNARARNRMTVFLDPAEGREQPLVEGSRSMDASEDPALRAELSRLRGLGYLS